MYISHSLIAISVFIMYMTVPFVIIPVVADICYDTPLTTLHNYRLWRYIIDTDTSLLVKMSHYTKTSL